MYTHTYVVVCITTEDINFKNTKIKDIITGNFMWKFFLKRSSFHKCIDNNSETKKNGSWYLLLIEVEDPSSW